jgi:hypothetical protein
MSSVQRRVGSFPHSDLASRVAVAKLRLGRHANPTLVGGSDDEPASSYRCRQERLRAVFDFDTYLSENLLVGTITTLDDERD